MSTPMTFMLFRNVATNKVVRVGDDGFLRQATFDAADPNDPNNPNKGGPPWWSDPRNMKQQWLHLPQSSLGTLKFMNRASGKVIDAQGGQLVNGALLQQYSDHRNSNQRWKIVATPENVSEFFIFADDSQKVWDVPSGSPDESLALQLFEKNGGANQRWKIEMAEAFHVFKIRSRATGLLLDVPNFSQDLGAAVQQIHDNGGLNQLWLIVDIGDGNNLIRSVCSGKLMDYPLAAFLAREPSGVGQYNYNEGTNQWWAVEVDSIDPNSGNPSLWTIRSRLPGLQSMYLDVPNSSLDDGVHIQTYPGNGGRNQRWILE